MTESFDPWPHFRLETAAFTTDRKGMNATTLPIAAELLKAAGESCLEAGMNAHIAKPIDAAKAERVIAKAMGRRENSVQQ